MSGPIAQRGADGDLAASLRRLLEAGEDRAACDPLLLSERWRVDPWASDPRASAGPAGRSAGAGAGGAAVGVAARPAARVDAPVRPGGAEAGAMPAQFSPAPPDGQPDAMRLRALVAELVREELQAAGAPWSAGTLRALIRAEVARALAEIRRD